MEAAKKKCPARDALGSGDHCRYEFTKKGCGSCRYNWLPFMYLILDVVGIKKVDTRDTEELRREIRRLRDENDVLGSILDRFSNGMRQVISAHEMARELRNMEGQNAKRSFDSYEGSEGGQDSKGDDGPWLLHGRDSM